MNGDGFGRRLRRLVDDRCNGDYVQFASDIGMSLTYLHKMMDEPFIVANPSILLLKRIAHRLGERVAFLLGEEEENDPIWIESNASWHSWIEKTEGLDARVAVGMRDNWRNEYAQERRGKQNCVLSRKSTQLMREADWNKKYQQAIKKGASNVSIREGTRLTG